MSRVQTQLLVLLSDGPALNAPVSNISNELHNLHYIRPQHDPIPPSGESAGVLHLNNLEVEK